ncbi:MAG: glycosyltransferase family 2 protein [Planctomycetes bacterium]|nr:glycosyltransferase family 2 protein [Planctomycetota bacterium]
MASDSRDGAAFRPRVSICIPTLNGGTEFLGVLAKIARQDYTPRAELVVIDSGSTDGTAEAAERAGAKMLRIDKRQFNHGKARNLAIAASSGEILALLTQDAEPQDEHWLAALVSAFQDPRVAGAYARQVPRPDCSPLIKWRLEQWNAGRTQRAVQELASREEYERLAPLERLARCAFDDVSSAVRRSAWERFPFEERKFGEDVAWCKRVLLAGERVVFEPGAVVIHSHELSTWYEFRRIYADHANLKELFDVHTIPTRDGLWRAFRHQRALYLRILSELGLPFGARLRAKAQAIPYAFFENLAQYLGARSARKLAEGSRFYRWVDRKLRRGV